MFAPVGFVDVVMLYFAVSVIRDVWLLVKYFLRKDVKDMPDAASTKNSLVHGKQGIPANVLYTVEEVYMLPGPRHKADEFLQKSQHLI